QAESRSNPDSSCGACRRRSTMQAARQSEKSRSAFRGSPAPEAGPTKKLPLFRNLLILTLGFRESSTGGGDYRSMAGDVRQECRGQGIRSGLGERAFLYFRPFFLGRAISWESDARPGGNIERGCEDTAAAGGRDAFCCAAIRHERLRASAADRAHEPTGGASV